MVIRLVAADGGLLDEMSVPATEERGWQTMRAELTPHRTALASLQIEFVGDGTVDLDEVSLIPADHWGAGDPRWSQGVLRRDLVEALRDMSPRFLRFPGGCVAEGLDCANAYDWKGTVGPIVSRTGDYSVWALNQVDGDAFQSNRIGFYEFFLLCEDLGIAPIPVVTAGLACQMRSRDVLPMDSAEFAAVVQNAVDLVEWATADPAASRWARLRADAGHPEPFALDTIALGNENWGPEYHERFAVLRDAVRARKPDMRLILSSGINPDGRPFEDSWAFAATDPANLLVDEHFYRKPEWVRESVGRYDDYDRSGPKVFLGEYAAHVPTILTPAVLRPTANSFESALSEAAFLTGIIRNLDVVEMTCYAPLLNRVGHAHWDHNLIDFNAFTVLPTANYLVQQLFASTTGTSTVDVVGALPSSIAASGTRSDTMQYLHLVNTGAAPVEVAVALGRRVDPAAPVRLRRIVAGLADRNELAATGDGGRNVSVTTEPAEVQEGALRIALPPRSVTVAEIPLNV